MPPSSHPESWRGGPRTTAAARRGPQAGEREVTWLLCERGIIIVVPEATRQYRPLFKTGWAFLGGEPSRMGCAGRSSLTSPLPGADVGHLAHPAWLQIRGWEGRAGCVLGGLWVERKPVSDKVAAAFTQATPARTQSTAGPPAPVRGARLPGGLPSVPSPSSPPPCLPLKSSRYR